MKLRVFVFCYLVLSSSLLVAETSLWAVSKNNTKIFLGGTVHVLSASDYPLPAAFEQAYQQASRLVFETDITQVNSLGFQQRMMAATIYTDGRTLRSELSASTWLKLEQYCARVDFPLSDIQLFKPGMASLILTIYELDRLGMADTGVDSYFYQQALVDSKTLGQLETPEQQLAFIATLGAGQEDELMLSTIRDMQELPDMMTALKAAWRTGDTQALEALGLVPMQQDFPALYKSLVLNRNLAWLPKIEAMLATPEVELILVGALHLVGEDGLLEQLSRRGYNIQSL